MISDNWMNKKITKIKLRARVAALCEFFFFLIMVDEWRSILQVNIFQFLL